MEDMILEVEEQIIETARSINLVIHTKDKLEQLEENERAVFVFPEHEPEVEEEQKGSGND